MAGIDPLMPVMAYKSYVIRAPRSTHFRDATCEEVECKANLEGWWTRLDVSTVIGQKQYNYIRLHAGRAYKQTAGFVTDYVELWFPPGQKCFAEHKVRLDREAFFIVRDGDRRGNPTGFKRLHTRPIDWRDDFGEHQQTLADEQQKG